MPPPNDNDSNEDEHFILDNGNIDIDRLRNNKATIKTSDVRRTNNSPTERSDEVNTKVFYDTLDWRTIEDDTYFDSDGDIFYDSKNDFVPDSSEPNREETVSRKVRWKKPLTETADRKPFISQHKE